MKMIMQVLSVGFILLSCCSCFAAEDVVVSSTQINVDVTKRKVVTHKDTTKSLAVGSPLGLMGVYQQAQIHDPVFQSAGFQKLAVEEGRIQAIAEFLPTIAGSADYTKTYQDIKSTDNSVVAAGDINYGSTTFGLTLTQPIFHWDSYVGLTQSKTNIVLAGTKYLLAEHDLILRVAELYFAAMSAQDQLEYAMAEQAAVEKHFELANGRFDMGLIPITDLHDAKARLAAIMAKSIAAHDLLDDALQALEEIIGEPVQSIKVLQENILMVSPKPEGLDLWIEKALEQNPSIRFQESTVDVASLEVDKQSAAHYPTIDLVGSYESEDTDGSIYGGGSDGETMDILMVLNVPLYEGGATSSRVREAKHLLSSARQDLVKQRRAVVRETRSAYLGVNSALRVIEALQQSVVSTHLALEAKQEGFLSGLYTSLNVLDAERDFSLANIDYAQARYDYLLNNLKLKQAVGTLTADDLHLLEQWLL